MNKTKKNVEEATLGNNKQKTKKKKHANHEKFYSSFHRVIQCCTNIHNIPKCTRLKLMWEIQDDIVLYKVSFRLDRSFDSTSLSSVSTQTYKFEL